MKISSHGFTLIELLIVVTIISIIGITSISGLSRMLTGQDAETTIKIISHTLDLFDRAVTRHQITSYETVFESGSLGFVANLDGYKKATPMKYSFDFITGSGVVRSTDTGTGMGELHLTSYDSIGKTLTIAANGGIQSFIFPRNIQKRRYDISGAIGERVLNSFIIQYYNLTNSAPENEIHLVKIFGGNNILYNSLIVRNILGKRVLQGSGVTIDTLEGATLTFEKNGKEMEMVISL